LLVGSAGSGKSTLMTDCARRLKKEGLSIWSTSGPRLIAGMAYLGQWEQRTQVVIGQLQGQRGILLAENLQDLVRLGGSEPGGSVASFLMGFVERADLQLVVECTPEEWSACRQLLPGFVELLEVFRLEEFTPAQALDVLQKVLSAAQQRRRLRLGSGLADTLYHLFARFMPYAAFPGACCRFALSWLARQPEGSLLERAQLVEAFSAETGLPERILRDEIVLTPEQIHSELEQQIVGQPQAVAMVTRLLATFKTGLHDPERPLGVFLFCGPTGVGKTEMARCLAQFLFGDKNRLIRLDMSEFASPGSAERLVGSVFSESPSVLIKQLRAQPFSVLLLDEIEKADSEVFDVLLRVLDDGVLTDPLGRRVSCQSSIVIMTSNLGADQLRTVGFLKGGGPNYESVALRFFRPEFVNRLDAVVGFQPLQFEQIRQIAARELQLLEQRPGLKRAGLTLRMSDSLLDWLAESGYDPNFGARPLQRLIEQKVVPVLARLDQKLTHLCLELDWDGQQVQVTNL